MLNINTFLFRIEVFIIYYYFINVYNKFSKWFFCVNLFESYRIILEVLFKAVLYS